jgi:hypothetical protein
VAGEGINEVLQLDYWMGEVRHGPKGADEGGTGVLIKEERNGGAAAAVRSGRRGHKAVERWEGG